MKTSSNIFVRVGIALGSIALYAVIFFTLYPSVGVGVAAFAVVPMAVAGWFLGIRGSLLFGVLNVLFSFFLLRLVGDPNADNLISNLSASFAFTLVGMMAGWIRELVNRVNKQTKELQEEIEKRIKVEKRLSYESLHDPLTNLANRRLFVNRLEYAIEWNKRHSTDPFAVVYLDFDHFKIINDTFGHNIGDQLLFGMAQRLKSAVRASDTVARLGGDEFAILVEAFKSDDEVFTLVTRIQEKLSAPFEVDGHSIVMTASLGILLNHLQYERLDDIMRDADIAMYSAKISGKNRFKIFDVLMREQAKDILKQESSLRNASGNGEFQIHYQSILSLKTQRITGFETLLSEEQPEKELLGQRTS